MRPAHHFYHAAVFTIREPWLINYFTTAFQLPSIVLGAGLSMSQALITFVGVPGHKQPKVMGECVAGREVKLLH